VVVWFCPLQNPPIEGNDFLANLLEAKPVYATDPYTGAAYHINPAAIANAGARLQQQSLGIVT
jgi:hypothetical protein